MPRKYYSQKILLKRIFVSLCGVLLLFISLVVVGRDLAQEKLPLAVSPAKQQVNLNPGQSQNLSVKFVNESDSPITGNIRAVDFIVTEESGAPTLLEGYDYPLSNQYSASTWVSLPYDKATIAANDVLRVNFKVNVPADAKSGGRYVAVYFESTGTLNQSPSTSSQFSAVSSKVVGLISIRVSGNISEEAYITHLDIPKFMEFGPVDVYFDIFNKGSLHITPTGQVILTDWFGNETDKETLENKNVFPDARRQYQAGLGKKWMLGRYKVEIVAAYGESGKTAQASQYVWIIPITLIVIMIFSITIAIMLGLYVYKKLTCRQKKLENKLEEEIKQIEQLKTRFKDKLPR